jgi:hypothetical protein
MDISDVGEGELTMLPTFALETFCIDTPDYAERKQAQREALAAEEEVIEADPAVVDDADDADDADDQGTELIDIPFVSDNMQDGELPLWELPEVSLMHVIH